MAAFTGGIRRPETKTNNQNQQQNSYDRLVTVVSYNTETKKLYCEDSVRKYEVYVNPVEVIKGDKTAEQMGVDRSKTWMGHSIDKSMEKHYPVGSKLILQRSKVMKKDNGQGFAVTEVQRVIGVPNPEPDKTFNGIFTVNSRTDENRLQRVSRVQHWNTYGIDVYDEEAIKSLYDKMSEASMNNGKKMGDYTVTLPNVGIQFRALLKTDAVNPYLESDAAEAHKNGVKNFDPCVYEIIDTSVPFDWIPGPLDESGKEIRSQAHPVSGDEMLDFIKQYIDYIATQDEFAEAYKKGLIKIEVCAFDSYPASNNKQLQLTWGDPRRDQTAEWNPLYQLSHKKSYVDMAQSVQLVGKNYAVKGIIQLSPNKLEKIAGKPTEIPSYWVNNLHVNHTKGHVHALVKSANGARTVPNDKIKLIQEVRNENTAQVSQSNQVRQLEPSAQVQPEATTSPAAPKTQPVYVEPTVDFDDDDFNPFESQTFPTSNQGSSKFNFNK